MTPRVEQLVDLGDLDSESELSGFQKEGILSCDAAVEPQFEGETAEITPLLESGGVVYFGQEGSYSMQLDIVEVVQTTTVMPVLKQLRFDQVLGNVDISARRMTYSQKRYYHSVMPTSHDENLKEELE